jgi:hypothetical protein
MARRPRVFVEGALYRVYNRSARGEGVFDDLEKAIGFVEQFREVKECEVSRLASKRQDSSTGRLRRMVASCLSKGGANAPGGWPGCCANTRLW